MSPLKKTFPDAALGGSGQMPPPQPDRARKSRSGTEVERPLMRYFGGKWQLRHWIIESFPPHRFYAEPFAGAASVLLAKQPAPGGELINDLNGDVINLFRVMQDDASAAALYRKLDWTLYSKAEFDLAKSPSTEPVERARRLLIRSFMGIGTAGEKANDRTSFRMANVDLRRLGDNQRRTFRNCAKDWSNWKDALEAIRCRLAGVMVYQRDALEFIDLMDAPDCLLYIDPPYHHETRSDRRYVVEFGPERHAELAARIVKCSAMVVLSGYDCPEYEALRDSGWFRREKDYRANMSNERRTECLWINPAAWKERHELPLVEAS